MNCSQVPVLSVDPLHFIDISSISEIRQLDSERQSLVYNHHHELIAASDTISSVRDVGYICSSPRLNLSI